jgi:hypothetical protein
MKQPSCTLSLLGRDVATVISFTFFTHNQKVIIQTMDELSKTKKNVNDIKQEEKTALAKLIRDEKVSDETFMWDHVTYNLIKREKTDQGWKLIANNSQKHHMMIIPCMRCLVVTLHTDPEKEEAHKTGTEFLITYLTSLTY